MKPCPDCGMNKWKFSMSGPMTVATCQGCGYQIRWKHKDKKLLGKDCPDCGVKMKKVEIPFNISVFEKNIYYTHKYVCPKCGKEINDETSKKVNMFYAK